MKTRIILLGIAFLLTSMQLSAQFSYGIRGGINNVIDMSGLPDESDYEIDYGKGNAGFHLGGIAQIKIASFFVQPELLFTVARADLKITDKLTTGEDIGKQSFRKIDVPVIAGMKFGPLKVQAGPVATMMMGSKIDLKNDLFDLDQTYSGATFGYQAGLGLELANLLLDIKYEGNLSKFGESVTIDNKTVDTDQRLSQWILSIGFLIGG